MSTFREYVNIALDEYRDSLETHGLSYPSQADNDLWYPLLRLLNAEKREKRENIADVTLIRQWEFKNVKTKDDIQSYTMAFWYAIAMIYGCALGELTKFDENGEVTLKSGG